MSSPKGLLSFGRPPSVPAKSLLGMWSYGKQVTTPIRSPTTSPHCPSACTASRSEGETEPGDRMQLIDVLFWGLVQEPTYRLNMQFSWQLFEDNWWFCRINKRQMTTNIMNKPISHTCKPLSITQCHFPTGLTRSLDLHCTKRATGSTDKKTNTMKKNLPRM